VQGLLGQTAWAATYAATGSGRHVAIKVLDPVVARQPGLIDELRRIRESLEDVPEHLIVAADEEGEDDETQAPFLVAPLSADPSLADLVEIFPLSPEETVGMVAGLAEALDAAREAGVAHLAL